MDIVDEADFEIHIYSSSVACRSDIYESLEFGSFMADRKVLLVQF